MAIPTYPFPSIAPHAPLARGGVVISRHVATLLANIHEKAVL